MMKAPSTPPFRRQNGALIPGSIAESKYICLGGLNQWVLIRGERIENPLLIILHGGPGFSDTTFFRYYSPQLEKKFTVVYWDQRGTGKSFNRNIPRSSMNVKQFMSDLDELVEAVCERTGQRKVAIFGHSWGSVLGPLYAARFPMKVSVYVGSGQIGDWAASEAASYAVALSEAKRLNNHKAVKQLIAIGPPPYSAECVFKERTLLQRLEGQLGITMMLRTLRMVLSVREASIFDLRSTFTAFRFSMYTMWSEVYRQNLLKSVPQLEMPVFFFLGRHDPWVPPETSEAYFNILTAPSKKIIWFDKSGHEVFMDEPEKFNQAMEELVLPIASA